MAGGDRLPRITPLTHELDSAAAAHGQDIDQGDQQQGRQQDLKEKREEKREEHRERREKGALSCAQANTNDALAHMSTYQPDK